MKKPSLIIILIIFLAGCLDNNLNIKELYKQPICGNNICEEGEEDYCLDCNLECKSELCNSKINIICQDCTETQKQLLSELLTKQTAAYYCLKNYFNYSPKRLIYHIITKPKVELETCTNKQGCYISGIGSGGRHKIQQSIIPGLINYSETEITEPENVGIELHELTHCFTDNAFGYDSPIWFNEGISIYTESRLQCHPDHLVTDRINNIMSSYENLKRGKSTLDEVAPYDNYYKTKHDSHIIGAIFFGALEQDYECGTECISKILYSVYQYRENCTEICFENAKILVPRLINLSLNNNDLRVPIITNTVIKQKSEEIIGKDLTSLFEILDITY